MIHASQREKIIGFDMDGVIIDFAELKQELARDFGHEISLPETASLVIEKKLGEEKYVQLQRLIYDDPVTALRPKLMTGVKEVLDLITKKKIPFYLISKRKSFEMASKLLEKRELWPKYFNEANVNFVKKKEEKNDVAAKLGVTHFIDDKLDYLEVVTAVPHRYLFDPFRVFDGQHQYQSIYSWKEFSDRVL